MPSLLSSLSLSALCLSRSRISVVPLIVVVVASPPSSPSHELPASSSWSPRHRRPLRLQSRRSRRRRRHLLAVIACCACTGGDAADWQIAWRLASGLRAGHPGLRAGHPSLRAGYPRGLWDFGMLGASLQTVGGASRSNGFSLQSNNSNRAAPGPITITMHFFAT